jgi:Tol biopolymer transport system component
VRSIRLDDTPGSVDFDKPCAETDPAWSPDGNRVVFGAYSYPVKSLQISSLDGSRMTTVLKSTDYRWYSHPDWRRLRLP